MTPTGRKRAYRHRIAAKLRQWRAGVCELCYGKGSPRELAHVGPTPLGGRGRGQSRRYLDLRQHPTCYARLCITCHRDLDCAATRAVCRADLNLSTPEWAT